MNQEKTKKTLKIIAFFLRIVAAIFGVGEKHIDKHVGNDATDGNERKALPPHDKGSQEQ